MAKIKYYLRDNSKESQIYISLSLKRGKVIRRKTGFTIDSKNWNTKKTIKNPELWNLPKQNNGHNKNLFTDLISLRRHLMSKVEKSIVDEIDGNWLSNEIDLYFGRISNNDYSSLLVDNFSYVIKDANIRENQKGGIGLSKSRIDAYKNTKRLIKQYQKSKRQSLKVVDVDLKFKTSFLNYLIKDQRLSENYALKILSNVKSVCNNAETIGVEVSRQLKNIKTKSIKNDFIIYLDFSELEKIKELELTSSALENARKWLILGCSIGQRGNDLLSITKNNFVIRNGLTLIELKQQKTNKNVAIPLNEDAEKIYKEGLPYGISIQKLNDHFKTLCKLAELNKPTKGRLYNKKTKRREIGEYEKWRLIGTHVCRRSFASNYYNKIPTGLLMQITGHSTEKMFLKYIGKENIDHAQQIADYFTKISIKNNSTPEDKTKNLKAI
jgi:integrase